MSFGRRAALIILFLALSTVAVRGWFATIIMLARGREQGKEAARAFDQFGNASVFAGSRFETISGHTGRLIESDAPPTWATRMHKFLDFFERGHCAKEKEREAPILAAIAAAEPTGKS